MQKDTVRIASFGIVLTDSPRQRLQPRPTIFAVAGAGATAAATTNMNIARLIGPPMLT